MDARTSLGRRVVAILNTGSGSCDASSQGQAREIFSGAGVEHVEIIVAEPRDIGEAIARAVSRCDVLVVLGGDGTIGTAATLCGEDGPHLVPLPGGTVNMLPRALYGAVGWQSALSATLERPCIRTVSGGDVEGHRFYCAAVLGAPSLWADAREAVREGDLAGAAKGAVTAMRRSLSDSIEFDFGELRGAAEAVAVICPLVSQDMDQDEAAFEAAALNPTTAAELFGLAFHAAFDGWRKDPSVTRSKVERVHVWANGDIPAILDGEKVQIARRVTITFHPLAFRALVPVGR